MKRSVVGQQLAGIVLLILITATVSSALLVMMQAERTALGASRRLAEVIDAAADLVAAAATLGDPGVDVRRRISDLGDAQSAMEAAWTRDLDSIRFVSGQEGLKERVKSGRSLLFTELRGLHADLAATVGADGGMAEELARYRKAANSLLRSLRDLRKAEMALRETAYTRTLLVFMLFTLFGTLSAGLWTITTLVRIMRDFRRILAYGRSVPTGGVLEPPDFPRNDEFGELRDHLKAMHAAEETLRQMKETSERILREHKNAEQSVQRLHGLASDQASALGETSRGFAEAADHFRMIAENASAALEAAEESSKGIEKSLGKIGDGISRAKSLEQTTAQIEEVVASIGDVADQTELLSLNAAIEAAHAGESGKGFAVVSQQVRKLADKSARQASEIGDLIQTVASTVRENSNDARQFSDVTESLKASFARLSGALQRITDLIHAGKQSIEKVEQSLGTAQDLVEKGTQTVQGVAAAQKALLQETDSLVHGGAPHAALPDAPQPTGRSPVPLVQPSRTHDAAPAAAEPRALPAGGESIEELVEEVEELQEIPEATEEGAGAGKPREASAAVAKDGLEELEAVEE